MRQISQNEYEIINFLSRMAGIDLKLPRDLQVWIVNEQMGSIRANDCPINRPLKVASYHEFADVDNISIVATLLITQDIKFGELDFWKVNDEPIIKQPSVNSNHE